VVKVVVLLPRQADMSPEAFGQHLRETHLPLVTRLPGLRRLVVNWVLPDPNASPPAYDAVAEDWFDDAAAMGAAFASPEGQAVAADVPVRAPGRGGGGGGGGSPADRIPRVLRRLSLAGDGSKPLLAFAGISHPRWTRHHHGRPQ
jgi:uncharacterized protein (TIGR02118 family)